MCCARRLPRSCCSVLILLNAWFGDTLVQFASDLMAGLSAIPEWVATVAVVGTRALAGHLRARRCRLGCLAPPVAAALHGRGRRRCGSTPDLAAHLHRGRGRGSDGGRHPSGEWFLGRDGFPSIVGLAAATAVVTAAAPWISRRWRRLGSALVLGLLVMVLLDSPISFEPFWAVTIGWLCGAAVLVVLGAPTRRPTRQAVIDGLNAVGLPVARLDAAKVDARGSTPYFGETTDGTRLFVKALGADQRSADLLFRLYRRIQPRDLGDERPFSSLRRAVEHEAYVALTARSLGVLTPRVLAFATAEPHGYVLAYEAIEGRSLDRLDAAEITDELLAEVWELVAQLRSHGIAHRDLRLANVFVAADRAVWAIDFGFSEVAASDVLLANDVVELAASCTVAVGAERAVAAARASVDPETLAHARRRLHTWALSGATRTALKQRPGVLDDLRARLAP
jgi:undecaprenyl-diphosphatase